jgi:hypothetical protein
MALAKPPPAGIGPGHGVFKVDAAGVVTATEWLEPGFLKLHAVRAHHSIRRSCIVNRSFPLNHRRGLPQQCWLHVFGCSLKHAIARGSVQHAQVKVL